MCCQGPKNELVAVRTEKLDLSMLHENQAEMREAATPSWPLSACNRPGEFKCLFLLSGTLWGHK